MYELEGDEEPANAPVAIKKRVDGLELGVRQTAADERRQIVLLVQELLQVVECTRHLGDRRRHKGSLRKGRVLRPDPVLALAELAGELVGPADAAHKLSVDLAYEPQREGEFGQPFQAVVHGADVVHDLFDIPGHLPLGRVQLEGEGILQRALDTLDLRAQHRLPAHVHGDEQVRIRQRPCHAVQPAHGLIRAREQPDHSEVHIDRRVRRKGRRNEGRVPGRLLHESTRT